MDQVPATVLEWHGFDDPLFIWGTIGSSRIIYKFTLDWTIFFLKNKWTYRKSIIRLLCYGLFVSCLHLYLPLHWCFCFKRQCFFPTVAMCRTQSRMGQCILCFMGTIKEVYNNHKNISVSISAHLSDSCSAGAWIPIDELNRAVFAHGRNCLQAVNFMSLITLEQQQDWLIASWHHMFPNTSKAGKIIHYNEVNKVNYTFKSTWKSLLTHCFVVFFCMACIMHLPVHDSRFVEIYKTTSDYGAVINVLIAQQNTQRSTENSCESCGLERTCLLETHYHFSHGTVSIKSYCNTNDSDPRCPCITW